MRVFAARSPPAVDASLTENFTERMARAGVQNVLDFFAKKLDPALIVNRAAVGGNKDLVE